MDTSYINIRLQKLRSLMEEQHIPALFFVNEANIRYLSGFTGTESYLLLAGNDFGSHNYFLTDSRYTEQAATECPEYQIVQCRGAYPTLPQRVAELCWNAGIRQLGFEKEHISYSLYADISTVCGNNISFIPTEPLAERLRIVKDAKEISLLQQACACTDQVFSSICNFIRPGRTEKEVEWQLFSLFHELDCGSSFQPIVVSGSRGAMPHGTASDKVLLPGEFVTMDFGCMYQGYRADMTRTVHLGPTTEQEQEIYNIVLTANQKAEAAIHAGVSGKEIDAIARTHIAEHGYGENFGHSLGHGVGLDIHERPNAGSRSEDILLPGSFVTVEPGIYISGWGGIRIEDTVLVREDGIENFFSSSKELICL